MCGHLEVRFGKHELTFEKKRLNPLLVATGGAIVEVGVLDHLAASGEALQPINVVRSLGLADIPCREFLDGRGRLVTPASIRNAVCE